MSISWVSGILRQYPNDKRPELMHVEVCSGLCLATNAHVILMSDTDLPDGPYDYVLNAKLPNRLYRNFFDSAIQKFSDAGGLPIVSGPEFTKQGVLFRDVLVQPKYWDLVKEGAINLRAGWWSKDLAYLLGSNPNGSFLIAGLKE